MDVSSGETESLFLEQSYYKKYMKHIQVHLAWSDWQELFVCWAAIDQDIKEKAKGCTECQLQRPAPPVVPLSPWKWSSHPWARIHSWTIHGPHVFTSNRHTLKMDGNNSNAFDYSHI